MSPEEVRNLDNEREALLVAQDRQRRLEEQQDAGIAAERYRSIEREGPGLRLRRHIPNGASQGVEGEKGIPRQRLIP